jgi:DNA-binding NarL/FixJ family response regulator
MPAVKILVADAQYLIRVGLVNLLSSNERFKVVGDATCSQEVKTLAAKHKPDVVIIDYNQPKHFILEDLAEVKKVSPKTNILIISSDETRDNIYKALDFGGISFLTKECDQEEIINAIIATAKGEKFICHKIIDIILDKQQTKDPDDCKPFNLSLREIEIIQMTAKGLPAKEIARQLYLSTHTVYTHKKNIMKKLKLTSSSEMMLYAINNGLASDN